MKNFNEEELKNKKLYLSPGQRENIYLSNKLYRIKKLFNHPKINLSREEIIHLINPLLEEEKKEMI